MALTFNGSNNTISGIASGGLNADAVGIDDLNATGTASASTYLRGDNSWAAISSVSNDSVAKGWINFNGDTFGARDSYNVASVSDEGTGHYKVNWDTDFANENYAHFIQTAQGYEENHPNASFVETPWIYDHEEAYLEFKIKKENNEHGGTIWTAVDCKDVCVVAFGDQ